MDEEGSSVYPTKRYLQSMGKAAANGYNANI